MTLASKKVQTDKKPRASRKVKCEPVVGPCVEPCVDVCVDEPAVVEEPAPALEEVKEVLEQIEEEVPESVCPPTAEEQIREQVNNHILQQLGLDSANCSVQFNIELKGPAFEKDASSDEESPISPCESPKAKRCKKESAPKPLQNEAGDYLNPRTNRYVKQGTAAFKKLVKEGVIVLAEPCV